MSQRLDRLQRRAKEFETEIKRIEAKNKESLEAILSEQYTPLKMKAEEVKDKLIKEHDETKQRTDTAKLVLLYIREEITNERVRIKREDTGWLPEGTIVKDIYRGTIRGEVVVFDDTQAISKGIARYNRPEIGSIVVFHLKADGTRGLKFTKAEYAMQQLKWTKA